MALQPSIILSGRGPNILGRIAQGTQAASMQNNVMRQNRLAQLFQDQGPGIAAGDPNALNAFAQMDPAAALGVKQTHQSMAISQEKLKMAREQARVAAQDRTRGLEAAQAAAEAAQLEQAVAAALQAQSQDQLDAYLRQSAPELVGKVTMENRELYAAQALGVKDALEMAKGPEPLSSLGKIQADINSGQLPEGTPLRASKQSETIYDGDGNVIIQRGGEKPPKLTVDAGKNTGFYIRTLDAHDTITELEEQGTDFFQQQTDKIPLGLGNYARSPDYQRFDQARRDFVNAILRRESGAVIADSEFENANKQYFPQPGDSPEVIAQKRRNRRNAIQGLKVGSGEGAGYVDRQNAASQDAGSGSPEIPAQTQPQAPGAGTAQALDDLERLLQKYGE